MPPKAKKGKGKGGDASGGAPDEGESQQHAFIQQSLQASVSTLRGRVRDLEESNTVLRRTRERMGKETKDFVSYFQTELEQRDAKIEELRDKLRTAEFEGAKAVKRLQHQLETQKESMAEAALKEQQGLRDKIDELQESLDALEHYKTHKTQIDAQVAGLADALAQERAARKEEVAGVERRWMLDKKAAIDERKKEFTSMKRRAREEAQARLDDDMKRIVVEAKKSTQDLRFLREQTRILKKEAASLTEQNKVLAREVEIAADTEHEYAAQAARREGERREMLARIHALEASVGSMAREYERKRASDVAAAGRNADDLAVEADGLRTLVRMKNQELRTVRRLAQAILSQRTEVETFLVEALTEVKAELRRRRAERRKQKDRAAVIGAGGLSLPSLVGAAVPRSPVRSSTRASASSASATANGAASVALADLSLEDRERVLSLLFAKINSAEAAEGMRGRAPSAATGTGTGRVSKLSVGDGFGGIGKPFGLDAELPAMLPGDAALRASHEGLQEPGNAHHGGGKTASGDDGNDDDNDDDAIVQAGPLASSLLQEAMQLDEGGSSSTEAAGLA